MREKSKIVTQLKAFRARLSNNWGHKHLYSFFDEIYLMLSSANSYSFGEIWEIERTIYDLISECKNYAFYKSYAIKCYECAVRLNTLLRNEQINIDKKIKGSLTHEDLYYNTFLDYDNKNYIWTSSTLKTNTYINTLKENKNFDEIHSVVILFFKLANQGRRPWDISSERVFLELTDLGSNLLEFYINNQNNISIFGKIYEHINTLNLQSSYEYLIKTIEHNSIDKRTERLYSSQANVLEKIVDFQLLFYIIWVEKDTETFLNSLSFEFTTNLLELYDDNKFEIFMKNFIALKNNNSKKIIEFYLQDDKVSIRSMLKRLMNE